MPPTRHDGSTVAPSALPLGQEPPSVGGAPAGPREAPSAPRVESEIPPGTAMVSMTVREALRDAMAEEMRADESVFVLGEEVAQYHGAYKVTQGLLEEFGPARVVDTPSGMIVHIPGSDFTDNRVLRSSSMDLWDVHKETFDYLYHREAPAFDIGDWDHRLADTGTRNLRGAGHEPRKAIGTVNTAEFFLTVAVSATFVWGDERPFRNTLRE